MSFGEITLYSPASFISPSPPGVDPKNSVRLHSLCILQGGGGGGAEDFRGSSEIFRAKKGGCENCLNISGGDAYFL